MIYKVFSKLHKIRNTENPLLGKVERILVINLQGLGDLLMTTPLIHALHQGGKTVDVLVMDKSKKEILVTNTDISTIYCFDAGLATFITLNKNKYDLIYLAYGAGPKSGIIFRTLKAKHKISHIYTLSGEQTAFGADIAIRTTPHMHRVEEHLKVLKQLDIQAEHPRYVLPLPKIAKVHAQQYITQHALEKKILLGIHPGGDKNNPHKRYPPKKYRLFIESLPKEYTPIIFLGPDEQELAEEFPNTLLFTGSLFDTAALIAQCKFFIHNDSGLGHIAASQDVPTISIFGPANWERIHPWGNDTIIRNKTAPTPRDLPMEQGYIDASQKMFSGQLTLKMLTEKP